MKMPNGYGSVYRLHGNRRKPWAVRVTVSKDPWKYKYLGYYETREDALTALALYNKDPYDLDTATITFAEAYRRWSEDHFPKLSPSAVRIHKAAYKVCAPLYNVRFADLRLVHLQTVIDTCGKNYPTLCTVRKLFNQLFIYAMRYDIVQKNYATFVDTEKYKGRNPNGYERVPFSPVEITDLWDRQDDPYTALVLILIYTGVRIGEMLNLRKENISLKDQYFRVTASKTAAGVRTVPIADCILPLVTAWMDRSPCDYLICTPAGKHMSTDYHSKYIWSAPDHKPHDTRHTFISLMAGAGIDERITKKIVGHSGSGITENVYTHLDVRILLDAVNKLKKTPDTGPG